MTHKPEYLTAEVLKAILNETLDEKLKIVPELQAENKTMKDKISQMEGKVIALENYSRHNIIVVHGIPYTEVAMNKGNLVGVHLEGRDIDIAHRLKSRNTVLPPPFVIKIVNR